ncbi:Fc.00g080850.m01.CDS01 [Cosmosporella sp. VM-42]
MASPNVPQTQVLAEVPVKGPKQLTLSDGTLCSFCDQMCNHPTEPGRPFHTRILPDLLKAAEYCGYCALWVRSLEASAHAIVESGQDTAAETHPLLQGFVDPEFVELQFVQTHDWIEGSIEQRIAWPQMGTFWATLDLVPGDQAWMINMEPLGASDQDDVVFGVVKNWLTECTKDHSECNQKRQTSWKPTRLLHLGTEPEMTTVRLVDGKDVPGGAAYLTLSHCWGDNVPLRLTGGSYARFKSDIPIEDLPKTFLDACKVTRKLNYEYLWIDSLCIVQDDPEDWAIEAGRMSSVYGNCFLNIAATAANDVHEGLFDSNEERDQSSWLPALIHRSQGGKFSGDYYVCNYRDWWAQLGNAPLNRRAWVFQERMLAPRVLHLGLEQVAFECLTMSVCERLPDGDFTHACGQQGRAGSTVKLFISSSRKGKDTPNIPDILAQWNEVVRNYSQGQLSVYTDKMVALSGIADPFLLAFRRYLSESIEGPEQRTEGAGDGDGDGDGNDSNPEAKGKEVAASSTPSRDLFLAGLWRPNMEMQLAWRATSEVQSHQLIGNAPPGYGQRPPTYVAPSWSWCSINAVLVEPQKANPFNISLAEVLDAKINPIPELKAGEEDNGLKYCCAPGSYLSLRCSLVPVVGFGNTGVLALPDFDGGDPTRLASRNYWDVAFDQEASNVEMACIVPIFVDMTRVSRAVHGLIVDARQDAEQSGKRYFVRLGAFVLDEREDIEAFWSVVEKFDVFNPGDMDSADVVDGVYRCVKFGREYEKKDGVLQRVIEIR